MINSDKTHEEQINWLSARDIARILFKQKTAIAFIFIFNVIAVTAYSFLVLPTYEAEGKLLIIAQKDTPIPYSRALTDMRAGIDIAFLESRLIRSNSVVGSAVKALKLHERPDPEGLRGTIYVFIRDTKEYLSDLKTDIKNKIILFFTGNTKKEKPKPTEFEKEVRRLSSKKVLSLNSLERTDIITIKVKDYDNIKASEIVNALGNAYILHSMVSQLKDLEKLYRDKHPQMAWLKNEINIQEKILNGNSNFNMEKLAGHTSSGSIKFMEMAIPPESPIKPKKIINIILGIVVGILVGVGYAFFKEIIDQSLKTPQDIEESIRAKTIASIPYTSKRLLAKLAKNPKKPSSRLESYLESIHTISTEVFLQKKENRLQTMMMISTDEGDGKTTLALDVATDLAHFSKQKVLLLEANFRSPSLENRYSKKSQNRLSEMDQEDVSFETIIFEDPDRQISVAIGAKDSVVPHVFFNSQEFTTFMENAKKTFDFIIIDTPNLRRYKDVLSLSDYVDGAYYIVNFYKTRKQLAEIAYNSLKQRNIPILGAILNFRKFVIPEFIYNKI